MTHDEKKKLDKFNNEAKALNDSRIDVPHDLENILKSFFIEIGVHEKVDGSAGYVSKTMLKAEYEADYLMAYRFKTGLSDLVFSTDSGLSALGGPHCLSIRSKREIDISKKKNSKSTCKVKSKATSDDIGKYLFMRGHGIVTRRPLILQLYNNTADMNKGNSVGGSDFSVSGGASRNDDDGNDEQEHEEESDGEESEKSVHVENANNNNKTITEGQEWGEFLHLPGRRFLALQR